MNVKIVFPEINNPIISEAIKKTGVNAVVADGLEEACLKVKNGEADAMVAGIDYASRDVILAARDGIGKASETFTSCFVMKKGEKKIIVADVATCKNPNVDQLVEIVLQTYTTAEKVLDTAPKVAMLSFSSFGSARNDASIDKMREAMEKVRIMRPDIAIDGEMQLDTAINPMIAEKKAPSSAVAGKANVLICPDLNSGNILYKAIEQFGGWTAAGPILQGFKAPVCDLSRGSTVDDVVLAIEMMEKING